MSQGRWILVIAIGFMLAGGYLAIRMLKKKGLVRGWRTEE